MWYSEAWKDYELIEASDGERLERWGKYNIVRPDPQVIWIKERHSDLWNRADAKYIRSNKGGGEWAVKNVPETWEINYRDLRFMVKPMNFKHMGIFPEQASNWDFIMETIRNSGRSVRVLNLFAYTGAATIAAASAGASVCHIDSSKGVVGMAKKNAALSGLSDAPIRYIVDDCKKFVMREIRRGNTYDAIIMDPPSYGRGPNGEVWKIEECIDEFLTMASMLLSKNPLFFLLSSYTGGMSPNAIKYLAELRIMKYRYGKVESDELGIPMRSQNGVLPAGASLRIKFDF